MNRNDAKDLFRKYNNGTASPKERALLENWYAGALLEMQQEAVEDDLLLLKHEAWVSIYEQTAAVKRISLWPRIAAAVALATLIFGAGLFYFSKNAGQSGAELAALTQDVAPGGIGATLTLASGKKIKLSDAKNGELAREAGVIITKSESGELVYQLKGDRGHSGGSNILSTAKGETYKLRLPDGSYVYLNAASSLTYTSGLVKNGKRMVELRGEGFFEVVKDKQHPFVVKTATQEVEVLGTEFNLNTYADEPVAATTLLEGRVKILAGQNTAFLKPGEQAINDGRTLNVAKVDVDKVVAWKNAKFVFDDENIESVMRKLSRWYNVEVVFQDKVGERTFSGSISRYDKISKILDKISFTDAVHFKIEGRRITVMK